MDEARFNLIAKALADPQRFAILQRIARQDDCPCMALVDECSITQATISHHLKVLRDAGIVDSERVGLWAFYYVIPDALKELETWLS